jgi:hypothetical protein
MSDKLKHLKKKLTGERNLASSCRALLMSFICVAIGSLAGCGGAEYLNDAIANAVGDKKRQARMAQTTIDQVYNCKVKSITGLEPSGMMEKSTKANKLFTTNSMSFIFDETTGILSGDGFNPLKMIVLQKGSNENSAIGYSTYKGSVSSGIAVLRIKKWEMNLPFLFLDSATLWTGSCEIK